MQGKEKMNRLRFTQINYLLSVLLAYVAVIPQITFGYEIDTHAQITY